MTEAWAVIPAGGSGTRFSETRDKLLCELGGRPVLLRTLAAFLSAASISGIVLVASEKALGVYQATVKEAFPEAPILHTTGGATRRASVYQGLLTVPQTAEIVVIHDAARPLIRPNLIDASVTAIRQGASGAVVAVPMVDTVKQAQPNGQFIEKTVDRALLWRAQTPQAFRKDVILQAHQGIPEETAVTDDAQLLELAGLGPVQLLAGDERNLKITGPQDLWLAEALLAHPQA
jgi:2-C-methyl-D-erythritol 4-phosphate cytidylyltransferase